MWFLMMVKSFFFVVVIFIGWKKLVVNLGLLVYLWIILINLLLFYFVSYCDN